MDFDNYFKIVLRSRGGNVWIQTRDEFRAESAVIKAVCSLGHKVKCWRASVGLFEFVKKDKDGKVERLAPPGVDRDTYQIVNACQQLYSYQNGGPMTVIMEDISEFLKNPQAMRWLKDLGSRSKSAPRDKQVQIVVIDSASCPPEGFVPVTLDLPDRAELRDIVMVTLAAAKVEADPEYVDAIINNVTGLEAVQAQRAIATCLAGKKREGDAPLTITPADVKRIMLAKKELIENVAGIRWIEPPEGGMSVVGGLDYIKEYCIMAEKPFRNYLLDPTVVRPRGFIACGVSGTGKTYSSRCVGAFLGIPVLELDVASTMGGIVSETERNIERALNISKACAPCVLCLDEIEKGLSGAAGDGRADGGVMSRVVDRLLKFLNDLKEPVFVVMTMNDPLKLKAFPELFRRGRFDKVFWVDTPNRKDRLEVLKIHAVAKGIDNVDFNAIVAATKGYTGSELASVLDEANWIAQSQERPVTTQDCLAAVKGVIPIVESWGGTGTLGETREWAKKGTIRANAPEDDDDSNTTVARIDMLDDEDPTRN